MVLWEALRGLQRCLLGEGSGRFPRSGTSPTSAEMHVIEKDSSGKETQIESSRTLEKSRRRSGEEEGMGRGTGHFSKGITVSTGRDCLSRVKGSRLRFKRIRCLQYVSQACAGQQKKIK